MTDPSSTTSDLAITERFLALMLGAAWRTEVLILQSFDDDKDRMRRERAAAKAAGSTRLSDRRAHMRSGTWDQLKGPASSWARDGCCVSWTLQAFEGKRRDHPDFFRGIRCLGLDFDTGEPLPTFPLIPHAIVETSPQHWHVYWRVSMTRAAFDRIMPVLQARYGADPNAIDVCRPLRLPGFLHQKRDERKGVDGPPHLVRLLDTHEGDAYAEDVCWQAFGVDDWWESHAETNGEAPGGPPGPKPPRPKTWPAMLPATGPFDWEAIAHALSYLSSDDRTLWLRIGMALASTRQPRARELWDQWSQGSAKYDADAQQATWDTFRENKQRVTDEQARVGLGTLFHLARSAGYTPAPADAWQRDILRNTQGDPIENTSNITLFLQHHPQWQDRLWWDAVAGVPMLDAEPITDGVVTDIGVWLGRTMQMSVRQLRLVERCLTAVCQQAPRDPILSWLEHLPPWDGVPRLDGWLSLVTQADETPYTADVSRVIPVSMVARAHVPGCLYRYVVVLEGPENTGKSSLVRALGQSWYSNMSMMLESKESHMAIQGVWVAELTELDALKRSDEQRITAFITMTQDDYVPKFSNFRAVYPRRTIFIGTTNDTQYLKGLNGNTRYLPVKTAAIDVELFMRRRDQIFAEAVQYYHDHPADWWALSAEAETDAISKRDERRVVNEYEAPLGEWLALSSKTTATWQEIAEGFLEMRHPSEWKDRSLQMQIASAMRAMGWIRKVKRDGTKTLRRWEST